jgi:hypothetical protein
MHFHTFHENKKSTVENGLEKSPDSRQFFSKDHGNHVNNMRNQRPGLSNRTQRSGNYVNRLL